MKTGIAVRPEHRTRRFTIGLPCALLSVQPVRSISRPKLATAGIHVMKVLTALGLADELADRLRPYPNGNTAMKAMAECPDPHAIGSTQVTEILITPGVELVADLPKEFELATVYTAAVCTRANHAQAAQDFIAALAGDAQAELRAQRGFLPA